MSHSPLLNLPGPSQDLLDDIESALARARDFVGAYDPELVVIFSPDHYNGFFYRTMPPFCIGTAAQGVGDYGTHAGPLNVPADVATDCARAVLESGIDVAISASMDVDHGTVQPLQKLFGDATARPVIPIFITPSRRHWDHCAECARWGQRLEHTWRRWVSGCSSWDPVGCPMIRRCRRWRRPHRLH
jgi:2,3-dihydroxyphenylpropionate 1,2-dioxygenase